MSGIIYMISSPNTNRVYIGSTTLALTTRFSRHKAVSNHTRSAIIIAAGDAKITELFKFETCTVEELRTKELEYINQYKDKLVNLCETRGYTGLTKKEISKKNYEQEFTECCMYCGTEIKQRNMKAHTKTMKHNIKKIEVMKHELGPDFNKIKVNGKQCSIA